MSPGGDLNAMKSQFDQILQGFIDKKEGIIQETMTFQQQQQNQEDDEECQEAEELVDNGIELTSESDEGEDQALNELTKGSRSQQNHLTQSEILRREMPQHIQMPHNNELNTESYLHEPPEAHLTQNNNEIETECPFSEHNYYKDTNLFQYTHSNQKRQEYQNLEEFENELEELTQQKGLTVHETNNSLNNPSHSVQQSTGPDSLMHATNSQDNSQNTLVHEYNKYVSQKQQNQAPQAQTATNTSKGQRLNIQLNQKSNGSQNEENENCYDTQNEEGPLSPPGHATLQSKPPAGKGSRMLQNQHQPQVQPQQQYNGAGVAASFDHIEDSRQKNLLRNIQ